MRIKKHLLIILLFVLVIGCRPDRREIIEVYQSGVIKKEFLYPDKKDNQNYTIAEYFENGNIMFRGTVQKGKFVGTKHNYYDNGRVKETDSLLNPCAMDFCCCDGKVFQYYSNGKMKRSFENRNGMANGLVTFYSSDSSGIIARMTEYKNDKKNGTEKQYFKSGDYSIGEFKNDTAVNYIYYFDTGGDTLKYFYHYNGRRDFPAKKWLANSQLFYGSYTDSSYENILLRWTDKNGKEIKREVRKWQKGEKTFTLPD